MAMDAEVAISLLIRNALFMLSEGKILSPGLCDQINTAIGDLQNKFVTSKLLESGTDNDQQSSEGSRLLDRARSAADIADKLLLEASQHSKSHEGRLAKIRALAHSMSLWIRVRTTKKMARDFITIVKELSTHLSHNDLPNLGANASSSNARRGKVRWSGKVESDVVGREDEADELLARLTLKDGDRHALKLRIVSVVGGENIGKTALVRSVYNRLEIDHIFQCRVWLHVPENFTLNTLKGLLVKILKQTPQPKLENVEHKEEEDLKEILHKSLMELRYLIVFDNLQKVEVMDDLMILLADSRNGSRVIVTTRNPEIPSLIDPWASPLKLQELDAEQSKRLLGECDSVAEDPGLTARILSKCSGSPPKILLLGGLAAASSDSSVMVDQHADNPTLHNIMFLSYRKLPSLLKPCLLYLCLFPRDSEISTRRLFRLWLAEGLVPVLEFSAMECFEELVGRNLVHVVRCRKLSGRPKSCRMPGFLHDFFCEMATQLKLLQIHSDTKCTYHREESKVVNDCAWIVNYQARNYHQKSPQGDNQLQYLGSYVSFKTQKLGTRSREVEELLRPLISKGYCGLLRVLDLEGVYKPLLPDGLGNVLLNLRYLGLRWTVLDSIPESVGNMSHLETLDLKYTNVIKLPSSIWKVESLHHLYMNEVCLDKSTSGRDQSRKYLNNLQTLWGLYIGAAKSPILDALRESTRLKKLGLTCGSLVKGVTERILGLTMLESLKLTSMGPLGQPSNLDLSNMRNLVSLSEMYLLGGLPPASLRLLPRKLKILTLSMSSLYDDPMLELGKLESLEILNLFAGSYTEGQLYCGANSFPCLRVLKLWTLEEVQKARVKETALCCLEEVEIKNCGRLTSIDSLAHIVSLKQISLIKARTELAENIKGRLTKNVFVKEKQMVSSSSSSTETMEDEDEERENEDEEMENEERGD